jgi:hypothetical protein
MAQQNDLSETRRTPTVSLQFFSVCIVPPRTRTSAPVRFALPRAYRSFP